MPQDPASFPPGSDQVHGCGFSVAASNIQFPLDEPSAWFSPNTRRHVGPSPRSSQAPRPCRHRLQGASLTPFEEGRDPLECSPAHQLRPVGEPNKCIANEAEAHDLRHVRSPAGLYAGPPGEVSPALAIRCPLPDSIVKSPQDGTRIWLHTALESLSCRPRRPKMLKDGYQWWLPPEQGCLGQFPVCSSN